jgi:hypothetical protein
VLWWLANGQSARNGITHSKKYTWQNINQCNLHHQPPKVIISIPDMPMPCIENTKYDNLQAIWCSTRWIRVNSVSQLLYHNLDARNCHYWYHPPPKSHYQQSIYASSVHIECEIWQSASNLIEYKTLWSTFYVRILSIKNLTKELPLTVSLTRKSHYQESRYANSMKICKQSDVIWDALDCILCWNLQHQKSHATTHLIKLKK